jgi:hypothetical protein
VAVKKMVARCGREAIFCYSEEPDAGVATTDTSPEQADMPLFLGAFRINARSLVTYSRMQVIPGLIGR